MSETTKFLLIMGYISLVIDVMALWYLIFAQRAQYLRVTMLATFILLTVLRIASIILATEVLGVHL